MSFTSAPTSMCWALVRLAWCVQHTVRILPNVFLVILLTSNCAYACWISGSQDCCGGVGDFLYAWARPSSDSDFCQCDVGDPIARTNHWNQCASPGERCTSSSPAKTSSALFPAPGSFTPASVDSTAEITDSKTYISFRSAGWSSQRGICTPRVSRMCAPGPGLNPNPRRASQSRARPPRMRPCQSDVPFAAILQRT